MSLVIGAAHESFVALGADSDGLKIAIVPAFDYVIGFGGSSASRNRAK